MGSAAGKSLKFATFDTKVYTCVNYWTNTNVES